MPELTKPVTETGENILFRSRRLVVTDRRLLFETKTVTLSAISSIKVESPDDREGARGASRRIGCVPAVAVILAGLGFALGGLYVGRGIPVVVGIFAFLGVSTAAVGIAILAKSGPRRAWRKLKRYSVKIHTVDGQKTRITGLKLSEAQQIANVISAATAQV